jgi:glycosyltransferase involved in cell wall biosynthesis
MIELATIGTEPAPAGGGNVSQRSPSAEGQQAVARRATTAAWVWPPAERVAVIVPALDEAATIALVLEPVLECARPDGPHRIFDEVVLVSDGSRDDTAQIARSLGATVVELAANGGKAAALAAGVERTDADVVLFLDGDLVGFDAATFRRLVRPVVAGAAAMVVGIRDRGPWLTGFHASQHGPLLSGVRCLRRDVFEAVPRDFVRGYRIETALNWTCRRLGGVLLTTPLHGIRHRIKERKRGVLPGFAARVAMFGSVFWAFVLLKLRQPPLRAGARPPRAAAALRSARA